MKELKYYEKHKEMCECLLVLSIIVFIVSIFIMFYQVHLIANEKYSYSFDWTDHTVKMRSNISSNEYNFLLILIFCGYLISIVTIGFFRFRFKRLAEKYRSEFLVNHFKKMYPNFEYIYNKGFDESELNETNLFPIYNNYHSEDMINGAMGNVNFDQLILS